MLPTVDADRFAIRELVENWALWRDAGVVLETGWEFRRWADGSVLFARHFGEACARRYGEHTWTMHRADLLAVLRSAIPDEAVKLGRRCTGVTQDADGVTLTFSSGGPVRADVVVGADGIHSVLRGHVTTASPPRESGLCAWRSLVPAGALGVPPRAGLPGASFVHAASHHRHWCLRRHSWGAGTEVMWSGGRSASAPYRQRWQAWKC